VFNEMIQILRKSADNMLDLVQSLFDVARLDQDSMALDFENLPLGETIDDASESAFSLVMGADVRMTPYAPSDLPRVRIAA
jgi:signal transduction histidine kinase